MTTPLSAQVVIASTDYSSHLLSLTREATLETPGAKVSLVMNDSFPFASVDPWDDLVVYENGTKTMTGYVTHIIASRVPASVEVQGFDTYKRCLEWFIDDNFYTGGPDAELTTDLTAHSLSYYVGYLCDLCGISYVITDSTGVGSTLLKSDIPLGLRTVSEALITLVQVGQWNMRVDANGVLQFEHINGPSVADYTLSTVMHYEEEYNDTDTRNQVKIWGLQDFDPLTSGSSFVGGGSVLYQESRDVDGVNHPRPMVFAGPFIDTIAKAQQVATAALDQWARLEHLLSLEMVGNPSIRVGQSVQYFHRRLTSGSYFDVVTDLRATVNMGGYRQDLTTGRRAYRYPYWPAPTTPIPEWDGGILPGEAYDCYIYGESVYSVGFVYLDNNGGYRKCWRIERRLIVDGTLVWGRTMDLTTLHPLYKYSNGDGSRANGAAIANGILFVTGDAQRDAFTPHLVWHNEAINIETGATLWSEDVSYSDFVNTHGRDIVADSVQVMFLGTYPFDIPNPTSGGSLTIQTAAATFRWYSPTNTKTLLGSAQPYEFRSAPDGTLMQYPYQNFYQIDLDSDGNYISSGAYQYPYLKQIVPIYWPPPQAYWYTVALPWFGKISRSGSVIWQIESAYPGIGVFPYGSDIAVSVDRNENRLYRLATDSHPSTVVGGLGKYNVTTNLWQVNIGFADLHGHVESGEWVFIAWTSSGVHGVQWYDTANGAFIGQRDQSGVQAHGIKLYVPTHRMAICGSKDGLFWTAMWDQPT